MTIYTEGKDVAGSDGSTTTEGSEVVVEGGSLERTLENLPLCRNILGRELAILLPESLDLPALLARQGLQEHWGTAMLRHKLAFVVHTVLEAGFRDRRVTERGGFVPLNTEQLRAFIGPRYTAQALTDLVAMGVLERYRDGAYSAKRFSRAFRLAEPFRAQGLRWDQLSGVALVRKVCTIDTARSTKAVGAVEGRRIVWESLQRLSLCRGTPAPNCSELSQPKLAARLFSLRDFQQQRHWLRADEETGRIFHNVTQCPRELRSFLLLNGEPTAEVDIANAQPFFLLSLYPPDHPERAAYASVVCAGRFYEAIFVAMDRRARKPWGTELDAWNVPGSTHRERFKKHVLASVLYQEEASDKKPRAVVFTFARLFPWLAEHLRAERAIPGGNSRLALRTQTIEAALILGSAIPRIRRDLPECLPVSIHDGILCQSRFASAVGRIVSEEAKAIHGRAPAVKVKNGVGAGQDTV